MRLGERSDLVIGGRVAGRVYHRRHDPNNGDNHIVVYLDPIGLAGLDGHAGRPAGQRQRPVPRLDRAGRLVPRLPGPLYPGRRQRTPRSAPSRPAICRWWSAPTTATIRPGRRHVQQQRAQPGPPPKPDLVAPGVVCSRPGRPRSSPAAIQACWSASRHQLRRPARHRRRRAVPRGGRVPAERRPAPLPGPGQLRSASGPGSRTAALATAT